MKSIGIWIVVLACLGFSSAWAKEQTFNSALDQRFTFYGGAQFFQAEGKFKNTVEGEPDVGVHLADLDVGIKGSVNGVTVASGDAQVLAPLPNFYVNGAYAFTEKFLL
jgi:hypothetical protein